MRLAIAVSVILIMPIGLPAAESFSGKVLGVTDGDTITVLRDGKPEKIRLAGIDCPDNC